MELFADCTLSCSVLSVSRGKLGYSISALPPGALIERRAFFNLPVFRSIVVRWRYGKLIGKTHLGMYCIYNGQQQKLLHEKAFELCYY